jgi:AbrB family looped-hinge helix DNA binding protein
MTTVARLQSRGQVTVPQEIRDACELSPGDDLLFVKTGARTFECRALPRRRALAEVLAQYQSDEDPPDLAQLREDFGNELAGRSRSDTTEERR